MDKGNLCIVDEAEIMDDEVIIQEKMLMELLPRNEGDDNMNVLKWCARRKLIRNSMSCNECETPCLFGRVKGQKDGCSWICTMRTCRKEKSICDGSFFSNSHLTIRQMLVMLYFWTTNTAQELIGREANIAAFHTVVDWCGFFRDVCEEHLEKNPDEIGGLKEDGQAVVVEIRASKFFYRKFRREQWRPEHWVLAGYERGTGKCFLVEVPNRHPESLIPIIEKHILGGTHIVSDYTDIGEIGGGALYTHGPTDPNHPRVPTIWSRCKRKVRDQTGMTDDLFTSYLHEFMWRKRFQDKNMFGNFLVCISQQYPFD